MGALLNSLVGITFLGLAVVLTFLMFYLWKFPYDHDNHRSSAPANLIRLHRFLGYAYVIIYIYLMWQMVPRLWAYQIELPARTVFHLMLGMSIGAILVIKITIVKFFRHMEAKLVPYLGTALLICSMLLIFLALPFSLREAYLSSNALDGDDTVMSQRIERVRQQLPKAGITDPEMIDLLASRESLDSGRDVLQTQCTQCHDLRTALARPRTPQSWRQTVSRMANRASVLNPISEQDQLEVTAYLIAISPTLQQTLIQKRDQNTSSINGQESANEAANMMISGAAMSMAYDPVEAESIFQQTCSQCHDYKQVDNAPPSSGIDAIALVQRMVDNGLIAGEKDLATIIRYLTETYTDDEFKPAEDEAEPEADDEDIDESEEDDSEEKNGDNEDTAMTQVAAVGNDLNGEMLFGQRGCIACHGAEGRAPIGPKYPTLAGQNKTYLANQIKDIASGERNNALTAVMKAIAGNLSDTEIDAIAQYLSELQ